MEGERHDHPAIPPLETLGPIAFLRALRTYWKRRAGNPFLSEGMRRLDRRRWLRHLPTVLMSLLLFGVLWNIMIGLDDGDLSTFWVVLAGIFAVFLLPPMGLLLLARAPGDVDRQAELACSLTTAGEWAFGAAFPAMRWVLRWQLFAGAVICAWAILTRVWFRMQWGGANSLFSLEELIGITLLLLLYFGSAAVVDVSAVALWFGTTRFRWSIMLGAGMDGFAQIALSMIVIVMLTGSIEEALINPLELDTHLENRLTEIAALCISIVYLTVWLLLVPWRRWRLAGAQYFAAIAPERLEASSWHVGSAATSVLLREGHPAAPSWRVYRGYAKPMLRAFLGTAFLVCTASIVGSLLIRPKPEDSFSQSFTLFDHPMVMLIRGAFTPFGAPTVPALFLLLLLHFRGKQSPDRRIPALVGRPMRTLQLLVVPLTALWCPLFLPVIAPPGVLDLLLLRGVQETAFAVYLSLGVLVLGSLFFSIIVAAGMIPRRGRRWVTISCIASWWVLAVTMTAASRVPRHLLLRFDYLGMENNLHEWAAVLMLALTPLLLLSIGYAVPWFLDRWQSEEFAGLKPATVTTDSISPEGP